MEKIPISFPPRTGLPARKQRPWQNILAQFPKAGKNCISGARLPQLTIPAIGFQHIIRFIAVSTIPAMLQLWESPSTCQTLSRLLRNGIREKDKPSIGEAFEKIGIRVVFYPSGLMGIHSINLPNGAPYGLEISDFKTAEAWDREEYPELFQAASDH
jgi:hypothetical protein